MSATHTSTDTIVVRRAVRADATGLERLAALDSAPALTGTLLVAESDGEARAAIELATGRVIADPFTPTAAHVALLRTRAAGVAEAPARLRRLALA